MNKDNLDDSIMDIDNYDCSYNCNILDNNPRQYKTNFVKNAKLPAEILLIIFNNLSVAQLLPCQWVSQHFRMAARITLMDRLGTDYLQYHQLGSHCLRRKFMNQSSDLVQDAEDQQSDLIFLNTNDNHNSNTPNPLLSQLQPVKPPPHQPSYVAPGTIVLSLFPTYDRPPSAWQERQTVHLQCTGIDRPKEQLIFSPIYRDVADSLKFNTNSWSLPTTSSPFNGSGGGSGSESPVESSPSWNPSTGLNLFNYSTGQPTQASTLPARTGLPDPIASYAFTDFFGSRKQSTGSESSSTTMNSNSYASSASSSPPQSTSSLYTSSSSSSLSSPIPTRPSPWSTAVSSGNSDQYSVISIKHGNWPEENQTSGDWWRGGLESGLNRQSMLFLPWVASSGGQGSAADSLQRKMQKMHAEEKMQKQISAGLPIEENEESSEGSDMELEENIGCNRTHIHHLYSLDGQAHRTPKSHSRYICLHHDQITPDINALKPSNGPNHALTMITAGSKNLSLDYEVNIVESNRCQFCLASSCKANIEIQVKVAEVRVSLDWIISGMAPEYNRAHPHVHSPKT